MDIHLPDEVLLTIFSYLDPVERSVVCMSVCRRWRRVARDASLWRHLKFGPYFSSKKMNAFLQLPYIENALSTLELMDYQTIPSVPNLATLIIASRELTEGKLYTTRDNLPSLRTVRFREYSNYPCDVADLKGLKADVGVEVDKLLFSVQKCETGTFCSDELSEFCRLYQVQDVSLFSTRVTEDQLKQAPFSLSSITRLSTWSSFKGLSLVAYPLNLTEFALSCGHVSKKEAFQVLPDSCPNLRVCDLMCKITEGDMVSVIALPHLEKLAISVNHFFSGDELVDVLKVWKNLRSLLINVDVISKRYLDVISTKNSDLLRLNINLWLPKGILSENASWTLGEIDPQSFGQERTKFQALEKLIFTSRILKILSLLSAPVCSSLTVDLDHLNIRKYEGVLATEDDVPNVSEACPSLQRIALPSLQHFRALKLPPSVNEFVASFDYNALCFFELHILQDLIACFPGLRELHFAVKIRSSSVDQCVEDTTALMKSLPNLEYLKLEARHYDSSSRDEVLKKQFLQKVRECLRPAKCYMENYRAAHFWFFPPFLRRNLEIQGFQHFEDTS